jgi:hypothetical protein
MFATISCSSKFVEPMMMVGFDGEELLPLLQLVKDTVATARATAPKSERRVVIRWPSLVAG